MSETISLSKQLSNLQFNVRIYRLFRYLFAFVSGFNAGIAIYCFFDGELCYALMCVFIAFLAHHFKKKHRSLQFSSEKRLDKLRSK